MKSTARFLLCALLLLWGCQGRPVADDGRSLEGDYLGQELPGAEPEIFAEGVISFGSHEHDLTISPSGDEIFFATSSSAMIGSDRRERL